MSDAAARLAPTRRLRVAVCAMDPPRRTALGKVVAEAGHIVVGTDDAADVVLVDGDSPPGEARPVVTLGGGADDAPGVLPAMRTLARSMQRYERLPPAWSSAGPARGKAASARCGRLSVTPF